MNWPTLIMSPPRSTASTWKRRAKRCIRFVRVRSAIFASPIFGRAISNHQVIARCQLAKRRMRR